MKRSLLLLSLAATLVSRPSLADGKPPPVAQAPDPNVCATATASARYVGYGYTHVVTLTNGCPKAVECALWTDLDPEPRQTVKVAAGQRVELVTRRGSPARAVSAQKSCSFQ